MKKISTLLFISLLFHATYATGNTAAQGRANKLQKGMNLSVWLESSYWFFSTTNFPDVNRYTEADIKNLHDLCFQTVRLPVFFEPFAGYTAPYTFKTADPNVARGLSYVDSVVAWTAKYNMMLVIDNHLPDDDNTYGLQTHFQITDANYNAQTNLMIAVWKQVISRYGYTDPNRVIFELRNEPNVVSDVNLHHLYQTLIDTIRVYDNSHTLIVGNTGYYDANALAASTPYADTNLIYTFHIYDGNPGGFCFQGISGVPATDSLSKAHTSFNRHGAAATDITAQVQSVHDWSVAKSLPVWLGEFGCTSLPEVYGDDTSRCNYIANMAAVLDATHIPWAYWDGYGPDEYFTSYDGGTTLNYLFSMFDRTNILDENHLNPCFKSALHLGSLCNAASGIENEEAANPKINIYPNPSTGAFYIDVNSQEMHQVKAFDMTGREVAITRNNSFFTIQNSGTYWIQILLKNGQLLTQKVIVDGEGN